VVLLEEREAASHAPRAFDAAPQEPPFENIPKVEDNKDALTEACCASPIMTLVGEQYELIRTARSVKRVVAHAATFPRGGKSFGPPDSELKPVFPPELELSGPSKLEGPRENM
jgi:hypothetical protein